MPSLIFAGAAILIAIYMAVFISLRLFAAKRGSESHGVSGNGAIRAVALSMLAFPLAL